MPNKDEEKALKESLEIFEKLFHEKCKAKDQLISFLTKNGFKVSKCTASPWNGDISNNLCYLFTISHNAPSPPGEFYSSWNSKANNLKYYPDWTNYLLNLKDLSDLDLFVNTNKYGTEIYLNISSDLFNYKYLSKINIATYSKANKTIMVNSFFDHIYNLLSSDKQEKIYNFLCEKISENNQIKIDSEIPEIVKPLLLFT